MSQSRVHAAWAAADRGKPLPTKDIGIFECMDMSQEDGHVWYETDPGGTLEEEWVKMTDNNSPHRFLALRRGNDLLVAAGRYWAIASSTTRLFAAGTIGDSNTDTGSQWTIELSANDRSLEGSTLLLEGSPSDWVQYGMDSDTVGAGEGWGDYPLPRFEGSKTD